MCKFQLQKCNLYTSKCAFAMVNIGSGHRSGPPSGTKHKYKYNSQLEIELSKVKVQISQEKI